MNHDLTTALTRLADKIKEHEDRLQTTEAATKQWIIDPFIEALGYNLNDPDEVVPEFHADVGIKKKDKVDYAIMRDSKPLMIIECKCYGSDLSKAHLDQLYRYFGTTDTRVAILTNGLDYRMYSDFEEDNKMDLTPFLTFQMTREDLMSKTLISRIQQLSKNHFNYPRLADIGRRLKAENAAYIWLEKQSVNPSDSFVRFILKEVTDDRATHNAIEEYRPIVKKTLAKFSEDKTTKTLKSFYAAKAGESTQNEGLSEQEPKIETTDEELEGVYTIKGIIQKWTGPDRISFKDNQTYLAIFLDQKITRTVCRLYLASLNKKHIEVKSPEGEWERYDIETCHDLYGLEEVLKNAVERLS